MGQEEETERPINNSEIIALRQKVMGPVVAVRASRKSQILDAHTHTHTHTPHTPDKYSECFKSAKMSEHLFMSALDREEICH